MLNLKNKTNTQLTNVIQADFKRNLQSKFQMQILAVAKVLYRLLMVSGWIFNLCKPSEKWGKGIPVACFITPANVLIIFSIKRVLLWKRKSSSDWLNHFCSTCILIDFFYSLSKTAIDCLNAELMHSMAAAKQFLRLFFSSLSMIWN